MSQPPAPVVRSLEPVGELQIHRLGSVVRFQCARCQRERKSSLVATRNGDWAQKVCTLCYGKETREQREQARARNQHERTEQAWKSAEVDKLKHRLPGIASLLSFLREAGVDADVARGGLLMINGSTVQPPRHLPPPETLEWKTIVDEMALRYAGRQFIKAVQDNARFGEGFRALFRERERGFVIMRGDVRLAVIHPTRAQVSQHEAVCGNFLLPGRHWERMANALNDAAEKLAAGSQHGLEAWTTAEEAAGIAESQRRSATVPRRIDQLPDDLAPELADACLNASRRIRLERQVAYERPVILQADVGQLTLLPVTRAGTRLLMPFRLDKGTVTLNGDLVLGDGDPLPLLIDADTPDEDAVTAWICALLGFADATCIEFELAGQIAQPRPASRGWRSHSATSHSRPTTRSLPDRQPWPGHLQPVGPWAHYSGSFVAGHRRRLNDGQMASAEACDRAHMVGIRLHPHETWVRPHARGVPDGHRDALPMAHTTRTKPLPAKLAEVRIFPQSDVAGRKHTETRQGHIG